jgi:hypothetical protein
MSYKKLVIEKNGETFDVKIPEHIFKSKKKNSYVYTLSEIDIFVARISKDRSPRTSKKQLVKLINNEMNTNFNSNSPIYISYKYRGEIRKIPLIYDYDFLKIAMDKEEYGSDFKWESANKNKIIANLFLSLGKEQKKHTLYNIFPKSMVHLLYDYSVKYQDLMNNLEVYPTFSNDYTKQLVSEFCDLEPLIKQRTQVYKMIRSAFLLNKKINKDTCVGYIDFAKKEDKKYHDQKNKLWEEKKRLRKMELDKLYPNTIMTYEEIYNSANERTDEYKELLKMAMFQSNQTGQDIDECLTDCSSDYQGHVKIKRK